LSVATLKPWCTTGSPRLVAGVAAVLLAMPAVPNVQ